MSFDLKTLKSRPLSEDEVKAIQSGDSSGMVTWLMQQLAIPDGENGSKREIKPGEGIEIGPFPDENSAKNFNAYYTGKAAEMLKWGKERNEKGRRIPATRATVREKEGGAYLWIVRIRE